MKILIAFDYGACIASSLTGIWPRPAHPAGNYEEKLETLWKDDL